jgi:hypothetical protein
VAEVARVTHAFLGLPLNPEKARATFASFTLPAAADDAEEPRGRFLRRWRTRIRKHDLEDMPITSREEFARRVDRALQALRGDARPEVRKEAEAARKGLLAADTVKRRSLHRLDFSVLVAQIERVEWALNEYEAQRDRRRRDDHEFFVILSAARARGYL